MDEQVTRQRISDAWRLHRQGNGSAAIESFQDILTTDAENIDALYGIGLAYRANGMPERAIESFTAAQAALRLAERAFRAENTEKTKEETPFTLNDPIAGEGDRFLILSRMINQRLEELGSASV